MQTNEKNHVAHIAEGPTLSALIEINKAYSYTDAPSMLGRMLRTARWPSCLALIASIFAVVASIKWRSEFGAQTAGVLLAGSVIWFKRDAFRHYYARKATAVFLETFTHRDQAIRYIMFCEQLPKEIAADAQVLERVLRLLEQRQKVRQAGLVTRHPVVAALLAVFLMLLGVLFSKGADASISATITATFLVGVLIVIAMQLGMIWRTREYRDEERVEFVLWLWAEASEMRSSAGRMSGTNI